MTNVCRCTCILLKKSLCIICPYSTHYHTIQYNNAFFPLQNKSKVDYFKSRHHIVFCLFCPIIHWPSWPIVSINSNNQFLCIMFHPHLWLSLHLEKTDSPWLAQIWLKLPACDPTTVAKDLQCIGGFRLIQRTDCLLIALAAVPIFYPVGALFS